MEKSNGNFTVAGTNIDEVKRKNANSGLSYNEVKELLARTTGGHGTSIYSDTDPEKIRKQINTDISQRKE
ncbi:gamma-type small acid-soluble spore protein [Ornithinibacillus bavariensis]|uniref:gamma-type small acid-soluble spore protein n=1 Tax=Ornithinibacillus bavariensis TaxID=545502 RepID=UPI000EC34E71|nr:gamma-type small acid-soluble spore protein [Ornithinibacillus sp.]